MIKKAIGVLALAAIMFSCGNKEQKKEEAVTVEKALTDIESLIDKKIVVAGTVNHVCSHGGKRMFIIGEDPDAAIKIKPSEELGIFEKELEGSHVVVNGVVKELRIDEAYVAELEAEEDTESEAVHDHSGGTHDEEAENEEKEYFAEMRAKIAESGKGYYSQFWIEASKFEVKECEHDHAEGEEHDHAENEEHDHEEDHGHDHAEGEERHRQPPRPPRDRRGLELADPLRADQGAGGGESTS